MAVSLSFTDDSGVIFKGSDVMTGDETIALNEKLVQDIMDGKEINYQIVDLVDVIDFKLTPGDIQTLAGQDAKAVHCNPDMVIAIVASSTLTYGMNKIYTSYLEASTKSENCKLFTSMDLAASWVEEMLKKTTQSDRT